MISDEHQVVNKTQIELEAKRYNATLTNYVRNYENESVQKRMVIEKIFGKENCEYFKAIGSEFDRTERKYLREDTTYYVNDRLFPKRIYIIGSCITLQRGVRTKENLISKIQALVNQYNYTVVGCTVSLGLVECDDILDNMLIRKGDIVIFIDANNTFNEETKQDFLCLTTKELFEQESRGTWYDDIPIHMNAVRTENLADYIYSKYLKETIQNRLQLDDKEALEILQHGKVVTDVQLDKIEKYIHSVQTYQINEHMNVGAIVMNCNPFTLGHQYLIETAAEKVDYLYVFIVQDNHSFYGFEDRMEMVKKGTQHLQNVIVVPSGEMILSFETMPIYFEKSKKQDAIVDATLDLEIFGQYIAPKLSIKYRFVGEEPLDKVTKQYNEQMQILLSQYGISVVEIPRKQFEKDAISASRVRKLLKEGNYEAAKNLVPMTTWEILYGDN